MLKIYVRNPGVEYKHPEWKQSPHYFYGWGCNPYHEEIVAYKPKKVLLGEALKYRGIQFLNSLIDVKRQVAQVFKTLVKKIK